MTPRAAGAVFLLGAVLATVASTAFASAGGPRISNRIGGLVPPGKVHDQSGCNPACGNGKLAFHGGSTMTTNKVYTVFWQPSGWFMDAGYQATVNRFFQDVAHDNNMPTNVYAATTQYSGIQYASTYGGTYTDTTTAFPASGCHLYGVGATLCLSDGQLRTELNNVILKQAWTKSPTTLFFIFTPKDVETCAQGSCAYVNYCAYHSYSGSLLYASMPYPFTTITGSNFGSCDSGQRPNNDDADSVLNVTSHEHNEAITDPRLNAWYDNAGYENGDKCAWYFGSVSGPNGTEYNQTINGHHYFLQLEFSNDSGTGGSCVQTHSVPGGGGGGGPTITSFNPTSGLVGQAVDIQGTNFTGATSVKFNGTPDPTYVVNSSSDISAHVPTGATSGFITVTTPSGTGTSSTQFVVSSAGGPTVTSFEPTSGPVGTNVSITGTGFTNATEVDFNGTPAVNFTVNSDTSINANVPGGATSGPIAVTTPIGTGQSSTSFTVTTVSPRPTITGFTPTQGYPGTKVTITGTNFTGATSVMLGSKAAAFTVNSSTSITATVPTEPYLGSYRWTVTTPSGTASSTSFFRYL